ncbi:MAG TPA: GFA family protein [Pseudobdellovibrionaceae bacterium]|jgi:hypothetical protein
MSDTKKIHGSCLCQKVSVTLENEPKTFSVCHCESCRKWSGGVSMSINGGEHLKFSGEEFVGRYSSSDWAERGFCKQCGTHLFYRLKKTDHYFLFAGLFGDAISPKFDLQEFIDQKPDYYSFSNETKSFTKAEGHKLLSEYLNRS